jgi:hypothetical protein
MAPGGRRAELIARLHVPPGSAWHARSSAGQARWAALGLDRAEARGHALQAEERGLADWVAEAGATGLSHGRTDGHVAVASGLLPDVPNGDVLVSANLFGEILGGHRGDHRNPLEAGVE